jgi:predicted TIM-barrel fold metal-dependent hydrolase
MQLTRQQLILFVLLTLVWGLNWPVLGLAPGGKAAVNDAVSRLASPPTPSR